MILLENGQNYRIFEINSSPIEQFRLRINILIPFNKSLVFKVLT